MVEAGPTQSAHAHAQGWAPSLHALTTSPTTLMLSPFVLGPALFLIGTICGWCVGRHHGACVLRAYKEGLDTGRANSCWVRGQIDSSKSVPPQS